MAIVQPVASTGNNLSSKPVNLVMLAFNSITPEMSMKQTDLPHKNTLDTGWQLLGKLNLSVDSDPNFAINLWLTELFRPLDLSADFEDRILASIRDTVARVLHSDAVSITRHIHLSIFSPHERIPDRKPWGFFHIERIENHGETGVVRNHAIDFYLYAEGQ